MNLNKEKYKDFINKVKNNKTEKYVCEFLEEDENGFVSCRKTPFCGYINNMINGLYYDCDSYF